MIVAAVLSVALGYILLVLESCCSRARRNSDSVRTIAVGYQRSRFAAAGDALALFVKQVL